MRFGIHCFAFLLIAGSLCAQETTVKKDVLATPGPNLFYVSPSLAVNERNRSVQVVWERHPGNHPDHATLARRLSPTGAFKGDVRTLIQGTNTYDPTVLYNKGKNEFVVIYADEFQNPVHTIFARRLNAKGQIKGAPVKISIDTGGSFVNQHPIATFDPVNKLYVIVWTRNSTTAGTIDGEGLVIAVLNEDLVATAGPVLLRAENSSVPVVASARDLFVTEAGRILVAFSEPTDASLQRAHYYVAAFESDLTGLKIKKLKKGAVSGLFLDAQFASLPSGMFLYFVDSNKIRKRKIDPLGKPAGAISSAFSPPLRSRALLLPGFAATPSPNTRTQGLLIAVEDARQQLGNGTIWIQQIDAAGKPIGAPEAIDSGFIVVADLQIVTLPSTTSAQGKFSVVYVNGGQVTIPPQGEFSELIHLNLTVPLQ